MSKPVFLNAPLPFPKMPVNEKEVKSFLGSDEYSIKPITDTDISALETKTITHQIGKKSFKFTQNDECPQIVLDHAKKFDYKQEEHVTFLSNIKQILKEKVSLFRSATLLTETGFTCSNDSVFSPLVTIIDKCILSSVNDDDIQPRYSSIPVHVVPEHDTDALYHLSAILKLISSPFYCGQPHGVVVLCASPHLMLPLYVLSKLLTTTSRPKYMYSFIPVNSECCPSDVNSVKDCISLVFGSADLDAAARSCIEALHQYRFAHWRPTVFLIEEAVEQKFITKLQNLLHELRLDSTCAPIQPVVQYINDLQSQFGAHVLQLKSDQSVDGPVIVYNIAPAALSVPCDQRIRSICHIIRFRTAKEAASIATHFHNNRSKFRRGCFSSNPTNGVMPVNLWLNSAPLIWQLTGLLGASGFEVIFNNSSYVQLLAELYTSPRLSNVLNTLHHTLPWPSTQSACSTDVSELIGLLKVARTTQDVWSKLDIEAIREKVVLSAIAMDMGEGLKKVIANYQACSDRAGMSSIEMMKKVASTGGLILANQCVAPAGPIIFLMTSDAAYSEPFMAFFFKLLFISLSNGNSVLIYHTQATILDKNPRFSKLLIAAQKQFPKGLIMVHESKSLKVDSISHILDSIPHPGLVVDPLLLWNTTFVANPNLSVNSVCLYRTISLFWSIGNDIFAN